MKGSYKTMIMILYKILWMCITKLLIHCDYLAKKKRMLNCYKMSMLIIKSNDQSLSDFSWKENSRLSKILNTWSHRTWNRFFWNLDFCNIVQMIKISTYFEIRKPFCMNCWFNRTLLYDLELYFYSWTS